MIFYEKAACRKGFSKGGLLRAKRLSNARQKAAFRDAKDGLLQGGSYEPLNQEVT